MAEQEVERQPFRDITPENSNVLLELQEAVDRKDGVRQSLTQALSKLAASSLPDDEEEVNAATRIGELYVAMTNLGVMDSSHESLMQELMVRARHDRSTGWNSNTSLVLPQLNRMF